MAINRRRAGVAYALNQPLQELTPEAIVAQRAPKTTDFAQLSTIWLDNSNDAVYILREITANVASWVACGSGAGVFDSLTVGGDFTQTAGDMDVDADTVALTATAAAATAVVIEASDVAGGIQLNSAGNISDSIYLHVDAGVTEKIRVHADQGTNAASIELVSDAGGVTVTSGLASDNSIVLKAFAGGIDVDADLQINVASAEAAADAVVITASDAVGGIDITTGGGEVTVDTGATGNIKLTPGAGTAAAAAITLDSKVGVATLTGLTTASSALEALTITNSEVTEGSGIIVTVSNQGTNDAKMSVEQVKTAAGSFVVNTKNVGAAALNGPIVVSWIVLN